MHPVETCIQAKLLNNINRNRASSQVSLKGIKFMFLKAFGQPGLHEEAWMSLSSFPDRSCVKSDVSDLHTGDKHDDIKHKRVCQLIYCPLNLSAILLAPQRTTRGRRRTAFRR